MLAGVRVYLMVDSASYYRTYPRDPKPIRAAILEARALGIPVIEYNPIRGRRVLTLLGLFDRDHRKFWIVDGNIIVLGGQNIDYDSLRPPEEGGSIDAMMEFSSPEAASYLTASFIHTWNAFTLDRLDPKDFQSADSASTLEFRLADQGHRKGGQVTTMFDAFFAFAEKELWLVQCYTYLTDALLDRIRAAVARGVRVNVVLSGNHLGIRFEQGSRYGMLDLLEAGATVYEYDSPAESLLHYKLIMADGVWASIGSANYNFRSQAFSRELSAIVSDAASMKIVQKSLEGILLLCRPVSMEEAARYRGLPYYLHHLLMQVWG